MGRYPMKVYITMFKRLNQRDNTVNDLYIIYWWDLLSWICTKLKSNELISLWPPCGSDTGAQHFGPEVF